LPEPGNREYLILRCLLHTTTSREQLDSLLHR